MAKLCLITDTHWGWKSDNKVFLDYNKHFLDNLFFPYIDKHKIKHVCHLGDLVERRKYVNYYTATRMRQDFLDPLRNRDVQFDIIAGNHDVYYKDTNTINALQELVAGIFPNARIHTKASEIKIDKVPIILVPWINQENKEETLKKIQDTKAQICFGHLGLTGFEMRRGIKETDGNDPGLFSKFDVVLSGHFHHKHSRGNIHYLGAPLEFDWGDYNDPKGFHIFDTKTRELTFIESPFTIFKKIFYNDKDKNVKEVMNVDFDKYSGCFCKLIIEEKTNPYCFDMFVEKLEQAEVSNLQVVEAHHNIDTLDDEAIISEAEDTFTIFRKAIEGMSSDIDKEGLVGVISELYQEALSLE